MYACLSGSVHATDMAYTFGYPLLQFNDAVKNNTGLTFAPIDYDDTDVAVSEMIITMWTNFAKFGYEPMSSWGFSIEL